MEIIAERSSGYAFIDLACFTTVKVGMCVNMMFRSSLHRLFYCQPFCRPGLSNMRQQHGLLHNTLLQFPYPFISFVADTQVSDDLRIGLLEKLIIDIWRALNDMGGN